jgi:hypothetical protein
MSNENKWGCIAWLVLLCLVISLGLTQCNSTSEPEPGAPTDVAKYVRVERVPMPNAWECYAFVYNNVLQVVCDVRE